MKKLLLLILLLLSIDMYSNDKNTHKPYKDDFKDYYEDEDDDEDEDDNDDHDDDEEDDNDDHDDDEEDDCDDDDDFPPTAPINDYINLALVLGCVYAFKTKNTKTSNKKL